MFGFFAVYNMNLKIVDVIKITAYMIARSDRHSVFKIEIFVNESQTWGTVDSSVITFLPNGMVLDVLTLTY